MQSLSGSVMIPCLRARKPDRARVEAGLTCMVLNYAKRCLPIACQVLTLVDGAWCPVQGFVSPAGSHGWELGTNESLGGVLYWVWAIVVSGTSIPTAPRSRAKKGSRSAQVAADHSHVSKVRNALFPQHRKNNERARVPLQLNGYLLS